MSNFQNEYELPESPIEENQKCSSQPNQVNSKPNIIIPAILTTLIQLTLNFFCFILLIVLFIVVIIVISSSTAAVKRIEDNMTIQSNNNPNKKPKLIVQITIDQMRGDNVQKYRKRFKPNGFNHFFNNGIYYRNAHYKHSVTYTAVGHASLLTGGNPLTHGIVGNNWFDPKTGKKMYNCEDSEHKEVNGQEIDGSSPKNLLSSTTGDEILLSHKNSKYFSISGKDRAAIMSAGRLGKAFWYNKKTGKFISSTYYYKKYPDWADKWNNEKKADQYKNKFWEPLYEKSSYLFADKNNTKYVVPKYPYSKEFPHKYDESKLYSIIELLPASDELTLDFAKTVIIEEKLGQRNENDESPDFLAISLSATDKIGHYFGPNSVEYEDNVYRVDGYLEDLIKLLDNKVGRDNYLVVLSGDHGVSPTPEYEQDLGYPAGHVDQNKFLGPLNEKLRTKYNLLSNEQIIAAFHAPSLYFNLTIIESKNLNLIEIENFVKNEMMKDDSVAYAYTKTDLINGAISPNPITRRLLYSFHPKRSGNVVLEQNQHMYMTDTVKVNVIAMHGSPYDYDTYVPLFFVGKNIKKGRFIDRRVCPEDIAVTLTTIVGTKAPTGSLGDPLFEITESNRAKFD